MAKHRHEHGLRPAARKNPSGNPSVSAHAWRGAWDRPMQIDESAHHPFTVARMTDHNVRGRDERDTMSRPPPAAPKASRKAKKAA